MARTPRSFSRGGHPEAKAREDIGQSQPREDVTEKAKQTDQQKEISEASLTRSPSRFVGVLRLLSRLRSTRFRRRGLPDGRTWRERVLSLKHRRCNETNQYHPTQQSPHENDRLPRNENVHGRTSGTKRLTITAIILRKASDFSWTHCQSFFALELQARRQQRQERRVATRPQKCLCRMERKCLCSSSCITPEMPGSGRKCRPSLNTF
jgi:hypothetical protein